MKTPPTLSELEQQMLSAFFELADTKLTAQVIARVCEQNGLDPHEAAHEMRVMLERNRHRRTQ